MPNELSKTTTVEYTPEFKRNLRVLAKKYPHIRSDVQPLIEQLQSGNLSGDQVPGVRHTIFKLRVRNSDLQKGKRSGYRLIYHLKASKRIVLVTIYSKLEQKDISTKRMQHILSEFGQSSL